MSIPTTAESGNDGTRETRLEENSAVLAAFDLPPARDCGPPKTVILAEDEPALRTLIGLTLESKGYSVLEAGSGLDAVRLCETHQGPIHLLITDVVMPGMGGRALADRLTSLRPELRVLYLSGYDGNALARYGIEETEVNFLRKPFSMADMGVKVREMLDVP